MYLKFDGKFQDSTTYTFNFRDAIQDITEGNVTRDNKFVFSTSNKIDSLSIQGYVTNLMTADSLKETMVGLYRTDDTVTIFNGSPYYFTETDENGHYSLDNLKNGKYLLYAFKDANKNLKLETNNEMYGFHKDTIDLNANIASINIPVFHLDLRPLKIQTALASGHYYNINYNKYITNYDLEPIQDSVKIYSDFDREHHSIRIYNTFPNKDSLKLYVKTYDSLNYSLVDTVYAKFKESTRKKEPLSIKITPANGSGISTDFHATIEFNKPILKVNSDSLFVQFDTTKIATFKTDTSLIFNKLNTIADIQTIINRAAADSVLARRKRREKVSLDSAKTAQKTTEKLQNVKQQIGKQKKPTNEANKGLQLYAGVGTFISVDGDTSSIAKINYKFIDPVDYGILEGNVHTTYKKYIIQLVNSSYEIMLSLKDPAYYKFVNIPVGKYKLRVLIDNNGDGVWSKGNMLIGEEPEDIYYFPQTISIKANWELRQDLTF